MNAIRALIRALILRSKVLYSSWPKASDSLVRQIFARVINLIDCCNISEIYHVKDNRYINTYKLGYHMFYNYFVYIYIYIFIHIIFLIKSQKSMPPKSRVYY
jgi:hypothetical protein